MLIDTSVKNQSSLFTTADHLTHPKYRSDIDGLRAIAVLSVIGFHAFPEWVVGGFIGVDVFFVISGFLISTIMFGSLERNQFSFIEFYSRRIRRIFPALIVVFVASIVLGWILLLPDEYKQLGKHVAGGAAFVSNFILWNESGYFDSASETKPLLHLWSLGVEEQFYILYPALLWVAWKRQVNLFLVTVCIAFVSLGINLWKFNTDYVGDFYSPQTRFWELMIGSMLAYHTSSRFKTSTKFFSNVVYWLRRVIRADLILAKRFISSDLVSISGITLLGIGVCVITKERGFPGGWALLPTMGAAMIISAGVGSWVNRKVLSTRILVSIGLISYPLYLWHWIILSFLYINEGTAPAIELRISAVIISFVLAWLTYVAIEKPIRFGGQSKLKIILLILSLSIVFCAGIFIKSNNGFPDRGNYTMRVALNENYGKWDFKKNSLCNQLYGEDQLTFCVTNSAEPDIILFGDSHANQLYPGLIEAYANSRGILSIGNGPPLDGVSVKFENVTEHPWQFGQESYRRVFNIISKSKTLKTVILASNWEPLIHGEFIQSEHKSRTGRIRLVDDNSNDNRSNIEVFEKSFEETISKLVKLDKNIIVVIDTPEIMVNTRVCLKNINSESLCSFERDQVFERQKYFREYLVRLRKKYPVIKVFDPVPIVCPEVMCEIHDEGNLHFRDLSHISSYTSQKIGLALKDVIDQK